MDEGEVILEEITPIRIEMFHLGDKCRRMLYCLAVTIPYKGKVDQKTSQLNASNKITADFSLYLKTSLSVKSDNTIQWFLWCLYILLYVQGSFKWQKYLV